MDKGLSYTILEALGDRECTIARPDLSRVFSEPLVLDLLARLADLFELFLVQLIHLKHLQILSHRLGIRSRPVQINQLHARRP